MVFSNDEAKPLLPVSSLPAEQLKDVDEESLQGKGSLWFRLSTVLLQAFFDTTCGLIVVGYQALLPIMLSTNAYAPVVCSTTPPADWSSAACQEAQELRLNLMSTVALGGLNLYMGFAGAIQHWLGPQRLSWLGALLFTIGLVMFGCGRWMIQLAPWCDGFLLGYLIIALGGASILLSSLHTANLFPRQRGTISSVYMASENVGSAVFLVFQLIWSHFEVSLSTIFFAYTTIPVLLAVFAFFFQTRTALVATSSKSERLAETYKTVQWKSPQFFLLLLWGPLGLTYSYFYLNNVFAELQWMGASEEAATHGAYVFSFLFMTVSIPAVVVVGFIVDRWGMWASMSFSVVVTACWGILSVVTTGPLWIQYITMVMFVFARQSLLGVWSHYANVMFGSNATHYLGVSFSIAGVSILTTYGWSHLAHHLGSYTGLNVAFTIVNCALSLAMAIMCYRWRIVG